MRASKGAEAGPRAGAGEVASSALSSRWSDEHVSIERVESLAGGVKAESALAFVANDDPRHLVVEPIDRVSFGHWLPCAGRAGVLLLCG